MLCGTPTFHWRGGEGCVKRTICSQRRLACFSWASPVSKRWKRGACTRRNYPSAPLRGVEKKHSRNESTSRQRYWFGSHCPGGAMAPLFSGYDAVARCLHGPRDTVYSCSIKSRVAAKLGSYNGIEQYCTVLHVTPRQGAQPRNTVELDDFISLLRAPSPAGKLRKVVRIRIVQPLPLLVHVISERSRAPEYFSALPHSRIRRRSSRLLYVTGCVNSLSMTHTPQRRRSGWHKWN